MGLDNPDEIIELILSKYSQRHNREHLQFETEMSSRLILPDIVALGYMNKGRWQHIAETYADLGMIPDDFSVNGLIYNIEEKPSLVWVYFSLAGVLLILSIISLIATKFYCMNAIIKAEIREKIKVEKELRKSEKRSRFYVNPQERIILLANLR